MTSCLACAFLKKQLAERDKHIGWYKKALAKAMERLNAVEETRREAGFQEEEIQSQEIVERAWRPPG